MSVVHVPSQETRRWTQPNLGDISGMLRATFNIDLLWNRGKVNPASRVYVHANNDDDADLSYPVAFLRTAAGSGDQWWALCGTVLFASANANPDSAYTQDATADSPTDLNHQYSDMVDHEGALVVSTSTDLHRLAAATWNRNWWTDAGDLNQAALTANIPHPLDVFNRLLVVCDNNFLHTVDRNNVVANKMITLPPEFRIRSIDHSVDRVWIGTEHLYGGAAEIFEWDGFTGTYNKRHKLEGSICFAIRVKDGVPHAITSAGLLFKHNGSTFARAGYLPVFSQQLYQDGAGFSAGEWKDNFTLNFVLRKNGMEVIDGKIHALLSGAVDEVTSQVFPNMRSGIWCFDEEIGFFHRYALSFYKSGSAADFGISMLSTPGALVNTNTRSAGKFLAGAGYFTDNGSTEKKGIFICDATETTAKQGYVVTAKIQTANVADQWNKLWVKFTKLKNANDRLLVKYRTADTEDLNLPFRAAATWTGASTFTTTESDFANAAVGDEIEVLQGKNAGYSTHITNIAEAGGTYTVTVDETMPTTSGTSMLLVSDWKKIEDPVTDLTITSKDFPVGGNAPWAQFKVELRGQKGSAEIEELLPETADAVTADD